MPQSGLVVITDFLREAEVESQVLADCAAVQTLLARDEHAIVQSAAAADALIVFHEVQLSEHCLERLSRCRGIIRCGVCFDNVDGQAAGKRGIVLCNVPDYGTEEVADHALMLLLAVARRLRSADASIRLGKWEPEVLYGTPRLRGKTLGILGCGRIGTAMARRAATLGMRVVFYDPYLPAGYEKALGVERCYELQPLLRQSEFLSLHCPLTPQTRHILNEETLSLLPRGAYVINTARGGCIDTRALREALDSERVGFAGLDVLDREPLDDEALRRHERVILTPHAAFYSVEGFEEMRRKAALEARRMLTDVPVRNPVNLEFLQNPRCAVPEFGAR